MVVFGMWIISPKTKILYHYILEWNCCEKIKQRLSNNLKFENQLPDEQIFSISLDCAV